jgi:cystathionine beta-lyase
MRAWFKRLLDNAAHATARLLTVRADHRVAPRAPYLQQEYLMKTDFSAMAPDTLLAHAGRQPAEHYGFVNTPVYRGSTITFADVDSLLAGTQRYQYGRKNNPSMESLNHAISALEGAAGSILCPSGLAACSGAILAVAGAGDHLLVADNVYGPTRLFCDTAAKRFGIATTYYDPTQGAAIDSLFRPNTKAVFAESPGSLTFELQDIAQLAEISHRHNALLIMDNTWATPLLFKALEQGVDLSLMAATKYVVGHSDALVGTIAASSRAWAQLQAYQYQAGVHVGADDANLTLRGLRTMGVRLARHQHSALQIAHWLETRREVARVIYPALPSHPQHELWRRDFTGASGLFSFVTRPAPFGAVKALLNQLQLFGLGYSWGGFESLAIPADPRTVRSASQWQEPGHLIRLHIGLEDPADLIQDLELGLQRFRQQC